MTETEKYLILKIILLFLLTWRLVSPVQIITSAYSKINRIFVLHFVLHIFPKDFKIVQSPAIMYKILELKNP